MATPQSVTLPDIPGAGDELEDYVAALFQASGHFVEKQIVEYAPTAILELDVFTTDYASEKPLRRLTEVKGGDWGYTELFKVVGWMRYLDIDHGGFFVTKWGDRETAPKKMGPLGLDVVCFDDFTTAAQQFQDHGFGSFADPDIIAVWRHSYSVERKLVTTILERAKSESAGAREAKTYHRLINNGTFQARAPEESLGMLYEAFMSHPKLTLGYALELDGGDFDPHTPKVVSPSFTASLNGAHPELQACMYFEHRARLAILKAAVDYALANPDGPPPLVSEEDGKFLFRGMAYHVLPRTFQDGMSWLRKQPSFPRYATFWQQFLWGWGGFYLQDRPEEEFEWMSQYSGIPVDEIPTALEAFDHFFPGSGDWFVTPGPTDVRMLKMVPWVFQGIGAHVRRGKYGLGHDVSALNAKALYTHSDLARRINCTVGFLKT